MSAQPYTTQVEAPSPAIARAPLATGLALAGARPRTYGNACGVASAVSVQATRAMGLESGIGGWTIVHDFKTHTRRPERSLT